MDDLSASGLGREGAAVDLLGRLDVEATLDVDKSWQVGARKVISGSFVASGYSCLRSEVSGKVNGTSNGGQSWEADGCKSSVVGDLNSTSNGLEEWHSEVCKLAISNDSQRTCTGSGRSDRGQVRSSNRGQVVSVESESSVDRSQRWNAYGGNVSEGHVGSPEQVGKADIQAVAIGINIDC